MDIKTIKELIKLIDESNLSEVRIEDGDFKITIRTNTYSEGRAVPQVVVPAATAPVLATAPVVAASPAANNTNAPAKEDKPVTAEAPAAGGKLVEIKSPMVGTFYRSPGPGKPSFVNVGDTIEKGKAVCIIEAMKLFNEIESDFSGRIVKVLVNDATPVEYEQPLFLVELA